MTWRGAGQHGGHCLGITDWVWAGLSEGKWGAAPRGLEMEG